MRGDARKFRANLRQAEMYSISIAKPPFGIKPKGGFCTKCRFIIAWKSQSFYRPIMQLPAIGRIFDISRFIVFSRKMQYNMENPFSREAFS